MYIYLYWANGPHGTHGPELLSSIRNIYVYIEPMGPMGPQTAQRLIITVHFTIIWGGLQGQASQ